MNANVCPYIVQWLHDYLFNRMQFVVVHGEQSPALLVLSGVPQGSVLGPLLFLIYINDITSHISPPSKVTLFANDIYAENYLSLNADKCHYMLFSKKRIHSPPPVSLHVDGCKLAMVKQTKYLGILSSEMSWTPHISAICAKERRLVGLLYCKFYKCSDKHTLLTLYAVRPHLEYCSCVWDPFSKM